ncbi:MAG: phospholipid carrier-dependent glycosyltransferase [Candidatus Eisenbacteria bacterium]|uniref:Phospholipid carrier-dependent glycosyltransferase n=1 Tax=Eiseniibacteriota bacterium TaxID=2212470 RepID=A0A538UBL4_UNCEI|nr:MAG: phospholipid carrier-dependent glycosyltransferase [Candidatus Eisenbacteria bacterium]
MSEGAPAPPPRPSGLERPWLAVALLALLLLASGGWIGLIEPTETRYAEIAREMLASGDWLTPRLDGIHHFHKPPVAYWAAASGMALLGVNAWGARLFGLLADVLTLALAAWIAARRFAALRIHGGRAAWALGSMLLFAVLARGVATDPFLTAAVTLYWALAPGSLALVALGLGFLTKGPVVFLHTALPVLVAALWARDRRYLALLGPPRGWIAFALVALPWYLMVVARTPGLLAYFLGNQVVARVATETHGRGGPPWYFLVVLLAGTAPWTMAIIVGLARTWRERVDPEARLLICWLLAPTIFLSFSGSKLPSYLLPCMPAAALLAARGLDSGLARWGALVMLGGLALYGGGELLEAASWTHRATPALAFDACAVLLLGGMLAARGRPAPAALAAALAIAMLGCALAPYETELGSPRQVALQLARVRHGEPVVEIGHFNAGVPFYLKERVRLVEVPREKGFEDPRSLAGVVASPESLRAWVARDGRIWAFGPAGHVREVCARAGLGLSPVARWRDETLGFLRAASESAQAR